jgi:hypothetical protein
MVRKPVAAVALVCALVPAFSGTASAQKVVPWATLESNANVVCLDYDDKIFKLPGLGALQKVKSEKDLTPALVKKSMVPYLTGELALEKTMVRKWSTLGTPKEPTYRVGWVRWLTLWKTVRIPSAEKYLAAAKKYDVKGMKAAGAAREAYDAEGTKLEKKILKFHVCQW